MSMFKSLFDKVTKSAQLVETESGQSPSWASHLYSWERDRYNRNAERYDSSRVVLGGALATGAAFGLVGLAVGGPFLLGPLGGAFIGTLCMKDIVESNSIMKTIRNCAESKEARQNRGPYKPSSVPSVGLK